MPQWQKIGIHVENWTEGSSVFVTSADTFSADSLGKNSPATDRERQAHFESQLQRIAKSLGSARIPVFIETSGRKLRLDKGCIGHAVAAKFLLKPTDGTQGFVEHVELAKYPA